MSERGWTLAGIATGRVNHHGALALAQDLIEASQRFTVDPLPFDNYLFTVKAEDWPKELVRQAEGFHPPNPEVEA